MAREPSLEVYRAVRDAHGATIPVTGIRAGKGLKKWKIKKEFLPFFAVLVNFGPPDPPPVRQLV